MGAGAAQCPGRAPWHPMATASSTRCVVSERQPSPHRLLHPTTAGGNAFLEASLGMRNDTMGVPCAGGTCAASPWAAALPFLLAQTHHGWGLWRAALTPSSRLHTHPKPQSCPQRPRGVGPGGAPSATPCSHHSPAEGKARRGRRPPVRLLLNRDAEHSPAQESSCHSGRCHIPLQRPRSSPWYCCPSHRQTPRPRPPQPGTFPRGTSPSLLPTPPAPHPSQHLPHSPLPTSSSLPHPREPPHGPRDPRAACPTHRGLAGPRAMTPISADEGSARATRYICPRSREMRAALCRPAQGTSSLRGPLSIPTGAAPQLRLEAGADPWCGCASVLRAPAALRPPCKAQIVECQDPHAVSTQEGQSIPRERARRSVRGHLRGGQRGVEQQRGPEPVELRQRQLAVLGRLRVREGPVGSGGGGMAELPGE